MGWPPGKRLSGRTGVRGGTAGDIARAPGHWALRHRTRFLFGSGACGRSVYPELTRGPEPALLSVPAERERSGRDSIPPTLTTRQMAPASRSVLPNGM